MPASMRLRANLNGVKADRYSDFVSRLSIGAESVFGHSLCEGQTSTGLVFGHSLCAVHSDTH